MHVWPRGGGGGYLVYIRILDFTSRELKHVSRVVSF